MDIPEERVEERRDDFCWEEDDVGETRYGKSPVLPADAAEEREEGGGGDERRRRGWMDRR